MQLPSPAIIKAWPPPNHVDPELRGNANLILNLVLFPIVMLLVVVRVFTRLCISRNFGLDDYLIVAAVFPATAFAVLTLYCQYHYYWDRHIWDYDLDQLPSSLKLIMASFILFDASTSLAKMSMLYLTYRIIGDGCRMLKQLIFTVMCVIATQGIVFVFIVIFECKPISSFWRLSFAPQYCIAQAPFLLACGIINTFTDILVVILPIPTVAKLKMPRREHLLIMVLFGAGFSIAIAGAVRTYYTYIVMVTADRTWMAFPVWLASDIELYLAIICACIPTTKKFFSLYVPRLFGFASADVSEISLPERADAEADLMSILERGGRQCVFSTLRSSQGMKLASSSVRNLCSKSAANVDTIKTSHDMQDRQLEMSDVGDHIGLSRAESYEELVASASQSRATQGAFG